MSPKRVAYSTGNNRFDRAVVVRVAFVSSLSPMSRTVRPLTVLLGVLVFAGCAGSGGVVANSPEEAYNRAGQYYEQGKFDRAVEWYRAVLDFGRTNEWADEAQIYIAKAYYESGQYLLAASEFTRFIDLYPNDPRTEEAAYERIRSYYQLSPAYNLDQTDTDRALAFIRIFQSRYPRSVFMEDLIEIQGDLREKLARKEFAAGRLYERRELYEAAEMQYEQLLAEYPTSPLADDALLGVLRTQTAFAAASVRARQAERFQAALDTYDRFIQLFPNSDLLREAEVFYDRAFTGLRAVGATPDGQASR